MEKCEHKNLTRRRGDAEEDKNILFSACFSVSPRLRVQLLALLCSSLALAQAPQAPQAVAPRIDTPVSFANSARVHELIRAGNLYLSVSDALALAIENNLDIELQRYGLPAADTDLLRAKGGGVVRGLNFLLSEAPVGVGGPLSPVVTNPATTQGTPGTSVATNALELGVLGEPQDNYSMQGTIPQSNGTVIPIFDPALIGQLNWTHTSTPESSFFSYQTNALVSNLTTANFGVQQGFASGAQVGLMFDNSHNNYNAINTSYAPYTAASLGLTVTQPLLRGFGPSLNRRFIRIAANERRIVQPALPPAGDPDGLRRRCASIPTSWPSTKTSKVKQETATLAAKLFDDVKAQVEEGTLAQVEMTRANAQVFSTRQDLINSRGLLDEQEAILKNHAHPHGQRRPRSAGRPHHPHRRADHSRQGRDPPHAGPDQRGAGQPPRPGPGAPADRQFAHRPGRRRSNATLPEVDLVGVMQNNGLGGAATSLAAGSATPLSSAATAARSTRCWRATTPPTASACRSRCPSTTASPKPTWRATKSR